MLRWPLLTVATVLLCLSASDVSADKIGSLSHKLQTSRSAKVRISAALSLAKLSDQRAIAALSKALREDPSPAIRRISAASLGQRLRGLSTKVRNGALVALREAARRDKDANVRSSASVALAKSNMGAGDGEQSAQRKARGILVGVTLPANRNRRLNSKTASLLQSTIREVIRDKAPSSVQNAPGTGMPSSQQLQRSRRAGYSVVPDVSKLKLIRRGRGVIVQCEVKMRLSPWAGEGEKWVAETTATVTGSGTVTSGSSSRAVSDSSQQCITAVVTQVVANQVVPFLVAKAR
jgi:hypothetical protein